MLCDKCKTNEATFHRSVNINGRGYETHLCAECASHMESDPFVNILSDMFDETLEWNEADREFVSNFNALNNFGPTVMPFDFVPKDKEKDYKLDECVLDKDAQLQTLKNQLKMAVEVENYEEAAKLKKEIDKLKNEK